MYIIDLHTHTISSGHAYSTLEENVKGAIRNKIKVLGISDHAPDMPGAPHPFHFLNMKVVPDFVHDVRILKGVEANIVDFNGNIDLSHRIQERMDYIIASLHPPVLVPSEKARNTQAVLSAMENPFIKIIGHPDDGRYPLDYETIVLKAKETRTLLEINNASLNPEGSRENTEENAIEILLLCKKYKVPVILGSDAHISYDVGNFDRCIKLLEMTSFPLELVINHQWDKFISYIQIEE